MADRLLSNPFAKALRDQMGAILGWSIATLVLMPVVIESYHLVLGTGAPNREKEIADFSRLMASFSYLLGEAIPIDNVGGYLTVRILSTLPLFLGVWAVLAATGTIRSEEEQGILDLHLAAPLSRGALLIQKMAALTLACAIIGIVTWIATVGGGVLFGEPVPADRAALAAANALTLAWFWGCLALFVSQWTASRRGAAGVVAAAMFAAYLIDANLSTRAGYKAITGLLPSHYYSVNKPLVPGRLFDWGAYAVLLVGGLGLAGLAAVLFTRRDLGFAFRLWATRGPVRPRTGGSLALLDGPFTRGLRDLIAPTLGWTAGLVVYIFMIESTSKEILEPLRSFANSPLGLMFRGMDTNMGLLQAMILSPLTILMAGFGLTQVAGWTADEESGRLELVLSTPLARIRLLLARFAAVATVTVAMVAVLAATIWAGGRLFQISVDGGKLWSGMLGLVPLVLVVVAAGWAGGAVLLRPAGAVPIIGAVLLIMFFFDILAPVFNPPEIVQGLSIFYHYGRPFLDGVRTAGLATLVGLVLAFLGLALWRFQARDIAK